MKVKDIMKTALMLSGKNDILSSSLFDENLTESEYKEICAAYPDIERLLFAVNSAISEICAYKRVLTTAEVIESNGTVMYPSLNKKILFPLNVYTNCGFADYKAYSDRIETVKGRIRFSYVYMPDKLTFFEEIAFPKYLTEETVAFLSLFYFYNGCGLYDNAVRYRRLYYDAALVMPLYRQYQPMPCMMW